MEDGKSKVIPVQDMNAYRGSGGVAPRILNLGSRWKRMVNFTRRPQSLLIAFCMCEMYLNLMTSSNLGVALVKFYLTVTASDGGIDFSPHNRVDTGLGAVACYVITTRD